MLARIFVLVGGLIVLALFAALVGPYFINWTGYRADFEREASAILGRPVKVNGEASARLIPFPSVTFTNVTVGGGADGAPSTTVEEFSMDAELAPFLSGEVLIFDMRLVRPNTVVWIDRDGKFNWAVDPRAPVAPRNIALEHVTITDGQVRVIRPGMPDRTLSQINAVVSAKSLAGPWRADGSLKADGRSTKIGLSTGIAGDEGMRLKLRAEPETSRLDFDLDGNVTTNAGQLAYAGDFRVAERPAAVEGLRGADGQPVPKALLGNRVAGKFKLDDRRLAVDEFRFETGPLDDPYVATGTADIGFGQAPSFSVKATGAQVRLGDDKAASPDKEVTFADRVDQLERALQGLPVPTIPGNVDIDLPAIVAGDTTIRDVAVSAISQAGNWQINRLSANLPGRTTLEGSGLLATAPEPSFKGKVVLAVAQPSGFANWLARDIDAPVRRLARAGFSANVDLKREEQTFEELELALGSARLTGSARRVAKPGDRPLLSATLTGGAVSADEVAALGSLLFSEKREARLGDHWVDVSAKVGPVGTAPLVAGGVDVAVRMADGTLDIDRLNISDLAGASLAAAGKIEALASSPSASLDATVIAPDLASLVRLASSLAPGNRLLAQLDRNAAAYPGLLSDTRIDVLSRSVREAGTDRLELDVKGKAGGSDIAGEIALAGDRTAPLNAGLTLDAKFANPDATALMALAGAPSLPLGMVGAGELTVAAKGTLAKGLETLLMAKGQDASASFKGTLLAPPEGFQARGKATVEAADIEPWLMTAGIALPGMGVGMESALAADIDYADGLLVVGKLGGTVAESAVSGDLNVEMKENAPAITGALMTDELELERLAQMVLGAEAFDSAAEGWPANPFQQKTAASFTADVDLNAATIAAGPNFTAYDAALKLKLDNDGLHVPKLSARLDDGQLNGLFELTNSGGTGLFSAQYKLSGAKVDSLLGSAGVSDAPMSGSADISGSVSGSGKSVGAVVASLAGSGTMTLKGLVIDEINPAAFSPLVKAADQVGRDIDAARVAGFAPELLRRGSFAAGDADIPFTVAGGVFRTAPVSFGEGPMKLSADLKLDASTLDFQSAGQLTYAAGDDALVGSEPTVGVSVAGKLGEAALALDTEPLAQFLTQRALEIEQARVEAMQAVLLEKQRLRRETRYYAALDAERVRVATEKRKAEEEARRKAEEEARLKAEDEAKLKAEQQAKADAEAKIKAEQEAKRLADEQAKTAAEAKAKAEEGAKRQAEEEAKRKAAEEAKRKADEEAKRKTEEAQRRAEATQQRKPSESAQQPETAKPIREAQPAPSRRTEPRRPAQPAKPAAGLF